MKVRIVIEDVPAEIHERLVRRAELRGKSLQEFLLDELEMLVPYPTISNKEWVEQARARVKASGSRVTAEDILNARDADRK